MGHVTPPFALLSSRRAAAEANRRWTEAPLAGEREQLVAVASTPAWRGNNGNVHPRMRIRWFAPGGSVSGMQRLPHALLADRNIILIFRLSSSTNSSVTDNGSAGR